MAAEVHGTIRLDTALSGDLPTSEWDVDYAALKDQDYAAAISERSLTGQLHVHRTLSAGSVMQFRDYSPRLILTRAELTALRLLVGKICYYMPHNRDEGGAAPNYRVVVFFQDMTEEKPLDPALTYYTAEIHLVDADGCTVD